MLKNQILIGDLSLEKIENKDIANKKKKKAFFF